MAKVSSWGYTNITPQSVDVTPTALGLVSNYAVIKNDATTCIMSNKTAPVDAEEIILLRSRNIEQVNHNLNIQYPNKVKGGVQYQSEAEAVLTTTDTSDPSYRIDDPIVCTITVRHSKSGNITGAHAKTVIMRALSGFIKDDGTWRLDDLMRGSERPVTD